ncbi:MAG: pentapeptide repeat-containing protein [Planctomycetota bacterium]
MIIPQVAPVRPRFIDPGTGQTFLLEDYVASTAKTSRTGTLRIQGPAGSGKTTALRHLAAQLSPSLNVECMDDADIDIVRSRSQSKFVVFCSESKAVIGPFRKLATWTNDDFIEYLLAVHPDHVKSVYSRVANASDRSCAGGIPDIWKSILDEFSRSDSLTSISDALTALLHRSTLRGMTQDQIGEFCVMALKMHDRVIKRSLVELTRDHKLGKKGTLQSRLEQLLRHRVVQTILAADWIAIRLKQGIRISDLIPISYAVVGGIARRVQSDQTAIDTLRDQAESSNMSAPLAASILNACQCDWRPDNQSAFLHGAQLAGAKWAGLKLADAHLKSANLSGADLSDSVIQNTVADEVQLSGAKLDRVCLLNCDFRESDLQASDGRNLSSQNVDFSGANLRSSDFSFAALENCRLNDADLRDCCLFSADLRNSDLTGANLTGADLRQTKLHDALLIRQPLREALLDGADFCDAKMLLCDLENVTLNRPSFMGANLQGAHLTGSTMVRADFRGANLFNCGLGEIDWEYANLRDAVLVGCSFHMGSTRCGLVDSPYPSEGTRTGFYTDDYDDQYFKAPEEIRKASLRGADIRGADITNVDFYLVDLRDAQYDDEQRIHLQRTGAILHARV